MKLKEIGLNSIWFGIIPKLTIFATIFVSPLITQYLTPNDYGIIGLASSYSSITMGFAVFGLQVHLTNSYYEYKSRFHFVWRRLIFWMILASLLAWFITMAIFWVALPNLSSWSRGLVILIAAIPVLLNFNTLIAQQYYNLRLKPKAYVLKNLLASFIGIGITFVSIYYFKWGYFGFFVSSASTSIILFFLFFKPLWISLKLYPVFNKPNSRVISWFRISLPMIPHQIGHILLSSSDRMVMSFLSISTYSIGIYSNGYEMGNYASVLIIALVTAIAPIIQTTIRTNNYLQLKKILIFTQVATLLIIFALSTWMKEIYLILVHNKELQASNLIAKQTCFSFALFPFYVIMSSFTFIEKKTNNVLWLIFIPAILNIILNFILIPIYGYKAAIVTTIISYWSISLVTIFVPYYRQHLLTWFGNIYYPLYLVILCCIIFIMSLFIGDLPTDWKTIATILVLVIIGIIAMVYRKNINSFEFIHVDVQ